MQVSTHRPLQFDAVIEAPFGAVGVAIQERQVSIALLFGNHALKSAVHPMAKQIAEQINAYFNSATYVFNMPLTLKDTPYQQRVWQAIRAIPVGQVQTYQALAQQLGSGARAVANACGANHLPLFIACHRVVAKSGLGGFMCGHPQGKLIKTALLKHEGINL
ncbi:MAG: methylated-DNA--[protein]-cysteine S-methyltransferase [Methylophilaceae bacterium]|nr:methylated-DNA--[protein]-cysteine S-methyltransferase [Methylophilaceae bacterium]